MTTPNIREQLHRQIDNLPDDIVEQVADFTQFVIARRRVARTYADWDPSRWHEFALQQLFSEDDEADYSLEDA
jgi:hypothetical protein